MVVYITRRPLISSLFALRFVPFRPLSSSPFNRKGKDGVDHATAQPFPPSSKSDSHPKRVHPPDHNQNAGPRLSDSPFYNPNFNSRANKFCVENRIGHYRLKKLKDLGKYKAQARERPNVMFNNMFLSPLHCCNHQHARYFEERESAMTGSYLALYAAKANRPLWWYVFAMRGEVKAYVAEAANRRTHSAILVALNAHGWDGFGRRLGPRDRRKDRPEVVKARATRRDYRQWEDDAQLYGTLKVDFYRPQGTCSTPYMVLVEQAMCLVDLLEQNIGQGCIQQVDQGIRQVASAEQPIGEGASSGKSPLAIRRV